MEKTALVVIDLQKGIAGMDRQLGPYSAKTVVENAAKLADACRQKEMPVFLVHVMPTKHTALKVETDSPMMRSGEMPEDWGDFVPEIGPKDNDIIKTKHQWGAFYGTGLDMEMRRRGIERIILCGIATSIGVESTARFAYEHGYNQIFAEDAMTSMSEEEHNASLKIFKKIGKVRKTEEIIKEI